MSDADSSLAIRRILVALDASPHSLAALDAAAALAARMEAELLGLFVEDVELLRFAEAPFAREILYPTATQTAIDRASIERKLRAQSRQARVALEAAAQRARVHCSFRTVRGRVAAELLAAAGQTDLVAIGRAGWSYGRPVRFGSTALEVATSAHTVLLIPERGLPDNVQPLVLYDGSPGAKHALLAAADLAKAGTHEMTVLLIAEEHSGAAARMRNEADALLAGKQVQIRYRRIESLNATSLHKALGTEKSEVMVLGSRHVLRQLKPLDKLLRETEVPLLLFGDGPDTRK